MVEKEKEAVLKSEQCDVSTSSVPRSQFPSCHGQSPEKQPLHMSPLCADVFISFPPFFLKKPLIHTSSDLGFFQFQLSCSLVFKEVKNLGELGLTLCLLAV